MKRRDEIEIKLKVVDRRRVKERIKTLGFTEASPRVHERNVLYDFPDRSLAKAECVLRLRSAGGQYWLTFKGKPRRSPKYKVREEIETAVEDGESADRLLQALGLRPVFVYEKDRTSYVHGHGSIRRRQPVLAFDETVAGDYVELEGPRSWIDGVAAQLGFDDSDYITTSYVKLIAAAGQAARYTHDRPPRFE
jgi:adenylate cyclase, class 2